MRLTVLGCSGADFPGYHLSSFLLDQKILLDAGSLTRVLSERDQMKIENIFITHAHLDHIMGIPFLADNIIVGKHRNRINLFAIPSVIKTIKRDLFNSAVWPDFTGIPNLEDSILNLIDLKVGESIQIEEFTITPYRVSHTVPAVGFLVEEERKSCLFYTGDTGPSVGTWNKLWNKKIGSVIIDVSFPNQLNVLSLETGHLTPLLLKAELLKIKPVPERVYVTHIKPQYERIIKKELQELRIPGLRVLDDGETLDL
jgi:ribonuclease BN (tRNA processing enzyme)